MKTSIQEFPQGTAIVQLDATKILQFRKELMEKKGVKVSIGDIFVKAAACGLEKVPEFNGAVWAMRSATTGAAISACPPVSMGSWSCL